MLDIPFTPDPNVRCFQTKHLRELHGLSIFEADELWMKARKQHLIIQAKLNNEDGRPQDAIRKLLEIVGMERMAHG